MNVPYISQWDDTAHLSRGDCGIVAACMVARWMGIHTTPDEMIVKSGIGIGRYVYDFPEVIRAGRVVGLRLTYRSAATWPVILSELKAHRPVVSLLRYGVISGNQDDFDGSHFWTCIGYDDDHVYVNDPNFWGNYRSQGECRPIPLDEFKQAIGPALLPTGNQAYQSILLSVGASGEAAG
jgi:hypothetical protein